MKRLTPVLAVLLTLANLLCANAGTSGERIPPVKDDFSLRINAVSGQVDIRQSENSGVWNHATQGNEFVPNAYLRTRVKSYAVLNLGELCTIAALDMTEVVLNSKPGISCRLSLSSGSIMADASDLPSDVIVEVAMSHAVARINKAKVILESSDVVSVVRVIEGSVTFTSREKGTVIQVTEGQIVRADGLGVSDPEQVDLVLEKLELAHYKTLAGQSPVKPVVKNVPESTDIAETILRIPFKWYLIGFLLLLMIISLIVLTRKRKKTTRPRPAGSKGVTSSNGELCVQCGSSLTKGAKFCSKCGVTVRQSASPAKEVITTENCICGAMIIPGEKFCTSCGTPVSTKISGAAKPSGTIISPGVYKEPL